MRKPRQDASTPEARNQGPDVPEKTVPRVIDPVLAKREADLNALLEKKMEDFDKSMDGNRVAQRFLESVRKTARETPTVTDILLSSTSLTEKNRRVLRFNRDGSISSLNTGNGYFYDWVKPDMPVPIIMDNCVIRMIVHEPLESIIIDVS